MSSLIVFGFFCVSGSCRIPSLKPGSMSNSCYTCYDTAIHASAGNSLQAEIIVEGVFSDAVIADHSVVFVVGKAYLPSTAACERGLLEAMYFVPLPGDPSCDVYKFILPQWNAAFVLGLGRVTSSFASHDDGHHNSISVSCSDYVWDGKMSSKLMYVFL
ncbi:hypothetical protein EDD15DRAFT_2158784 [Pisolithus albus]|nr:hypothetical protein EDD15DRAFT_2158784 [Pisolithus albus]